MYLPKSKYKPAKYTRGNEFALKDGSEYTGWCFETYRGEVYTGEKPSNDSQLLTSIEYSPGSSEKKFKSDLITPTDLDYRNGYFTRYFVQDKRNNALIEVNYVNYKYYSKKRYTRYVEVKWLLTTPVENINKGLYIYFGSEAKNKEAIKEAEKTINGLSILIKSYSQFVK